MTFQAYEESVESGRPVELYKFTVGATVYRYTSAEDDVIPPFEANTYVSRQITRNAPGMENEDRRTPLKVTLPTDDALATRFIDIPPGPGVELTITRYHRDDGDGEAYIIWQGRVISATYDKDGGSCTFDCVTDEAAFSRPIPRFKYQGLCNHVLYDAGCTVVRTSFKHTGTVTAVVGNKVTVDSVSSNGADWAVGGYIDNGNGDYRMVVSQSGDELTTLVAFETSPLGSSVDVYAGCDHTLNTCDSKFSNTVNYGGFPYVPTFNPFERGL